jgi:hypothetical protein
MTTVAKTYGALVKHEHGWFVECEPHVALRLKRTFGRLATNASIIQLSDTPENARDLEWFMERFPLQMQSAHRKYLEKRSDEHQECETEVERLLQGGVHEARAFELAAPARDYQRVAAEMALTTRGLLLADEVGLGKAQPLDAKVLTPSGWRSMGDLAVGDEIVDPDGDLLSHDPVSRSLRRRSSVRAVFERGVREVWRLTADDGATTTCCQDHLWCIDMAHADDGSVGRSVVSTMELRRLLREARSAGDTIYLPVSHLERASRPDLKRAIVSVEPTGQMSEMRCIRVDTSLRLYITDDHIVTHNTCAAICTLTDPTILPALVVTLTHLPRQWAAEIARFAPSLRTHIVKSGQPYDITRLGKVRGSQLSLQDQIPDVIIINYHKLAGWTDVLPRLVKGVIFDEVQELRHRDSARYRAARRLSQAVPFRMGLSATPIFNLGGEMFSVLDVLRPGVLGTANEFFIEWCSGYSEKPSLKDPAAFGSYLRTEGLMLRRTRVEVGRELPPVTKVNYEIESDTSAIDAVAGSAAELARIILGGGPGKKAEKWRASEELSIKLRQATGIAKAPFVADFVRLMVESGEKVVLYGWHREVYNIWLERLKDLAPALYTGTESPTQKEAARQRFIKGETSILIMSLRSGAGLDGLQFVSRTVVFGELDWSPGVLEQCGGRVARDGQKEPVVIYYLITDSGSDPIMADTLGLKRQQIDGLRDPDAPLVEDISVLQEQERGNVKRLAEAFLKQRGIELPSPPKKPKAAE